MVENFKHKEWKKDSFKKKKKEWKKDIIKVKLGEHKDIYKYKE